MGKLKQAHFTDFININQYSPIPKYLQLADSIIRAIEDKNIMNEDMLPSLNELTFNLEISRQTAEKGYKHLCQLGVINAVPGKGYYIATTEPGRRINVFLLMNKLSRSKKLLYDAFIAELGQSGRVDLFIYNNDIASFKEILLRNKNDYTHYVIMPPLEDAVNSAQKVISEIPRDKLIVLDKRVCLGEGRYGGVYENFEKDIFEALEKARPLLMKYTTLKILYPNDSHLPKEIVIGFSRFCEGYSFDMSIVDNVREASVTKGDAFICLTEGQLTELLEEIKQLNFQVGIDTGIISYNETPLKKHILNGITTMSADFKQMGIKAAQMVLGDYREEIELDFQLNIRDSL